jgi:hypothetical protein
MSRKSIFLALSFLALVALALAACTPTEVIKTVVVTQEVQVAGTPVIQEVVVTATPEPVVATAAAPRTLVICMGQEPDTPSMMARLIPTPSLSNPLSWRNCPA